MALQRIGVRLSPVARQLTRPMLAGALGGAAALLARNMLGSSALLQLLVAGTIGLAVYLAVAVPRRELRTWIAAIRPVPATE